MDDRKTAKNILGSTLQPCCHENSTGFYRNGHCHTGNLDHGVHVVCAVVTDAFLAYSEAQSLDLITPNPLYRFPGLKNGDSWCLCASRWLEAFGAGVASPIKAQATHEKALELIPLEILLKCQVD